MKSLHILLIILVVGIIGCSSSTTPKSEWLYQVEKRNGDIAVLQQESSSLHHVVRTEDITLPLESLLYGSIENSGVTFLEYEGLESKIRVSVLVYNVQQDSAASYLANQE